jgi:hypothetical protein
VKPLAISRDWRPAITVDGDRITAGSYVGNGVAAALLAGKTVRDLIRGEDTELVHLPWVGHRARRWEPEPLRWVGVNLGRKLTESIDRAEDAGNPRIRNAIFRRRRSGRQACQVRSGSQLSSQKGPAVGGRLVPPAQVTSDT